MEFNRKQKIVIYSVAAMSAFTLGRFSVPTVKETKTEITTETKTESKNDSSTSETNFNKTNKEINKKNNKIYIKVETILPDGTRRIETKIVDKGTITVDTSNNSSSDRKTDSSSETQTGTAQITKTETKTEVNKSNNNLSVLMGKNIKDFSETPTFGAHFSKKLLGPLAVGAFGLSNGTIGFSIGVEFWK